jgi:hypothetical protein
MTDSIKSIEQQSAPPVNSVNNDGRPSNLNGISPDQASFDQAVKNTGTGSGNDLFNQLALNKDPASLSNQNTGNEPLSDLFGTPDNALQQLAEDAGVEAKDGQFGLEEFAAMNEAIKKNFPELWAQLNGQGNMSPSEAMKAAGPAQSAGQGAEVPGAGGASEGGAPAAEAPPPASSAPPSGSEGAPAGPEGAPPPSGPPPSAASESAAPVEAASEGLTPEELVELLKKMANGEELSPEEKAQLGQVLSQFVDEEGKFDAEGFQQALSGTEMSDEQLQQLSEDVAPLAEAIANESGGDPSAITPDMFENPSDELGQALEEFSQIGQQSSDPVVSSAASDSLASLGSASMGDTFFDLMAAA